MKIIELGSILYVYKEVLETFSYFEFEDEIFIGLIKIKENYRNKGHGTEILNKVCEYADHKNKLITLTPLETEEFENEPIFNLVSYYSSKFGFVLNEGEKQIFHIKDKMYRKPNSYKKKKKRVNAQ